MPWLSVIIKMNKKMKIIYVPLENIEQRYTKMMNQSLKSYVDIYLYPNFNYPDIIEEGQFLDINKTIIFKSMQLQMIAEMFYRKKIKNGDIFLIGDIFFPGIESIRYMAELQDIDIKIYGFNYAGRADENDFVKKLGDWADASEHGYHLICDGIFVGSNHHKKNILSYFEYISPNIIHNTGYIWNRNHVRNIFNKKVKKEDYIIFPHRLSKEKGIDDFLYFAHKCQKKIIVTSGGNPIEIEMPNNVIYKSNLSKKEYYKIMSKAKWYLSTAYQETFGYTLQEAIHFDCEIAVPNRACYPEMVPDECLYNNIDEVNFFRVDEKYTEKYNNNFLKILKIISNENFNSRK